MKGSVGARVERLATDLESDLVQNPHRPTAILYLTILATGAAASEKSIVHLIIADDATNLDLSLYKRDQLDTPRTSRRAAPGLTFNKGPSGFRVGSGACGEKLTCRPIRGSDRSN